MRRYHRLISFIAGLFLLIVSTTGVLLHVREFLEEEEREGGSPQQISYNLVTKLSSGMPAEWSAALNKGLATVAAQSPNSRVSRIRIDLDGEQPRFVIQTMGKPAINYIIAQDGHIVKAVPQEKNLLLRLHTGEIIGDAGEVMNLVMGFGMVVLVVTGCVLLWEVFRAAPDAVTGVRRILGIKSKE
jgi:uncharacterized iron-regulated membrane protein